MHRSGIFDPPNERNPILDCRHPTRPAENPNTHDKTDTIPASYKYTGLFHLHARKEYNII